MSKIGKVSRLDMQMLYAMNDARYYRVVSDVLKEYLLTENKVTEIETDDPRDELSFEIQGIAHQVHECSSSLELSELVANTFNASFDTSFSGKDFTSVSVKIFTELEARGRALSLT